MDLARIKTWIDDCTGETTTVGAALRELLAFYENRDGTHRGWLFNIGTPVTYTGGKFAEYSFSGNVIARFENSRGLRYYIVEDDRGLCLPFVSGNLFRA